jgi:hypothetical protein
MKVYLVFGNRFDGAEFWEHVDSVHETEESAETKQLLLEEDPDKKTGMSYHIVAYDVENIKL